MIGYIKAVIFFEGLTATSGRNLAPIRPHSPPHRLATITDGVAGWLPGAARSVLAGQSTAIPKTADGVVEMMRQLKITRDTAVKARTTAMNTLKQIIVHAPPELREALHGLTDHGLLTRCAGLRPGPVDTPTASAKHTLRALARRWIALSEEMAIHDQHLARLTTETAPTLREGFGVGAHTAAELLIIFGDNPPDSFGSRVRDALRRVPDPGLVRDDHRPAPPQSRRPPGEFYDQA